MLKKNCLTWLLLTSVAGCSFFDEKNKVPLTGERISVVSFNQELIPNPLLKQQPIVWPKAVNMQEWPQPGGSASHLIAPRSLGTKFKQVWATSIGYGSDKSSYLASGPVAGEGKIFTLDTRGLIQATDAKSGKKLWQTEVSPYPGADRTLNGGVSYHDGAVYAATGYGEAVKIDSTTGAVVWQRQLNMPLRTAPSLTANHLYVVSLNNELFALDQQTGEIQWTHAGIPESTALIGAASPAVADGLILIPYTSGEVYALQEDNGHILWSENLNTSKRIDPASAISHVRARPVIIDQTAILMSHSGRMIAIDVRSGQHLWEREVGGVRSPAVVSPYVYILTLNNQLVCLHYKTGEVYWVNKLPASKKSKKLLVWAGPILADNQLILVNSDGLIVSIDSKTGDINEQIATRSRYLLSPIIVDNMLYLLAENGTLSAWQ